MPGDQRSTQRESTTAGDLLAELEADPEWVAARDAHESQLEADEAASRAAQVDLLADLAAAGLHVEDVWLLDRSAAGYERATPVLLAHLHRGYEDDVREGIARALGHRVAARHWAQVLAIYREVDASDFPRTREGLAVALSEMATKQQLPDVRLLLGDHSLGRDRMFFLRTLTRLRAEHRWELISALAFDPDIGGEARHLLRQRRRRRR